MSEKVIYKISNVTKEFPGVTALDSIDLEFKEGEIHAVVGENGAGKSTLMNILSGVYTPTEGSLEFDGKPVKFNSPLAAQQHGIAMIHQELSLSGSLSIAENIFQARLPKKKSGFLDKKKLYSETYELLKQVGLEAFDPSTIVRNINVSQQQMVEIAKALSMNARLLILDEPTSSLTLGETERLMNIMRRLKAQGITMLFITHKLDEVMEISDRFTVFRDGCKIGTKVTKESTMEEMITMMVGRQYSKRYEREKYMSKEDYANAKPVLEVDHLSVKPKVQDVSFKLYEGEILGITGLVGAGRSEVLQAVFGADKYDEGTIKVNGKEVNMYYTSEAIKHGIGLVPEGRKQQGILAQLSVKHNISSVNLGKLRGKLGFLSPKKEHEKVIDYVNKLSVKTPTLTQRITKLSGGNQQKAIIARWLMNNPKILFLDEPTQGIDVGTKTEIYKIIDNLSKDGLSIIMVSSEMPENISLCDRIIVMYEGRVTGEVLHDEANEDIIMTYASGQAHNIIK